MTAPLPITVLLYASATNASVGRLAAATIVPAFLLAGSFVIFVVSVQIVDLISQISVNKYFVLFVVSAVFVVFRYCCRTSSGASGVFAHTVRDFLLE